MRAGGRAAQGQQLARHDAGGHRCGERYDGPGGAHQPGWPEAPGAYATFDGQAVTLCRHERELARPGADCARLVGTQRDFARGLAGRVETERFVRGTLRCDLPLRTR